MNPKYITTGTSNRSAPAPSSDLLRPSEDAESRSTSPDSTPPSPSSNSVPTSSFISIRCSASPPDAPEEERAATGSQSSAPYHDGHPARSAPSPSSSVPRFRKVSNLALRRGRGAVAALTHQKPPRSPMRCLS